MPITPLILQTTSGAHRFTVEMALSEKQRETGMMFRDKMADDAGMLFSTGGDEVTTMWMKNTLLPLDIIFIGADGRVAAIAENAVPHSLQPLSSGVPVRAVLELKAGTARRIGLEEGDMAQNVLFGNAPKEVKP